MEIGLLMIYLFKANVYLALFYLGNKLLLANETQHKTIRLVWLLSTIAALILPQFSLSLSLFVSEIESGGVLTIPSNLLVERDYSAISKSESLFTLQNITITLFIAYILGVTATLFTKVTLYFKLIYFIGRCRVVDDKYTTQRFKELCKEMKINRKIKLREHGAISSPLSWINYIILDGEKEDKDNIVIHELAHIKYRHSLDIIFMDLLSIPLWFNPSIYLIKRQLQQIHEYQADALVLKMGANIKEYQLLLIKKAVGTQLHSMANSFNHSNLKKRITMMLKTKSSRWAALKAIYALPLALVVATVYANDTVSESLNKVSEVKVNQFSRSIQTDTITTKEKVNPIIVLDDKVVDSMDNIDHNTIASINVFKDGKYDGYATLTNEQQKQASEGGLILIISKDPTSSQSDITVVGYGTQRKDDKDNIVVVSKIGTTEREGEPPISYLTTSSADKNLLFIVDKKVFNGNIKDIDADKIKSITVLKGDADVDKIKEEARESGALKVSYSKDELKERRIQTAKELIPDISQTDLKKAENGLFIVDLK